jgi:hypothetical protein
MRAFANGRDRRRKLTVAVSGVAAAAALSAGVLTQSGAAEAGHSVAAAQALPAATIKARQHYFGLDNVDPATGAVRSDRVIMSWAGVATFAGSFNGHVVLIDAWVPRGPSTTWNHSLQYVGTTPDELKALAPEAYFVGHMHGDHGGDAPKIIEANPNIAVYGNQNHCDDLKAEVAQDDSSLMFNCFAVFPSVQVQNGRPVPSSFGMVDNLPANTLPGVRVSAVMHPHSLAPTDPATDPPFDTMQATKRPCAAFTQYPPSAGDPPSSGSPASGIINIAWQFRIGDFALTWADSNGPDVGGRDAQAWASLPATDVYFGAIAISGRSILNEGISQIRPKLFLPIHHDPCANDVYKEVKDQIATVPAASRPQLRYLSDPGDYLNPIIFDPTAKAWAQNGVSDAAPHTEAPSTATMTLDTAAPAPAAATGNVVVTLPGTGTAASSATKLTIRLAKVRGGRLAIKITGVPTAGTLKVALTSKVAGRRVALGSASRTLRRASTATLRLKLSKSARRLLKTHRSLRASLKLTYSAAGARATSVTRTVRLSR